MGTVINFNRARKKLAKARKENRASENRRRSGRTKSEKSKVKAEKQSAKRLLDGHKMDDAADKGEDKNEG